MTIESIKFNLFIDALNAFQTAKDIIQDYSGLGIKEIQIHYTPQGGYRRFATGKRPEKKQKIETCYYSSGVEINYIV